MLSMDLLVDIFFVADVVINFHTGVIIEHVRPLFPLVWSPSLVGGQMSLGVGLTQTSAGGGGSGLSPAQLCAEAVEGICVGSPSSQRWQPPHTSGSIPCLHMHHVIAQAGGPHSAAVY